jgi:F-type H+-transporting ATPase subunit epsilon
MALPAGILTYEVEAEGNRYVAIDDGVLVKTGAAVLVAVRRARAGTVLSELRDAVEQEFASVDEREQAVRSVMAKLEAGFLHRLAVLQHD